MSYSAIMGAVNSRVLIDTLMQQNQRCYLKKPPCILSSGGHRELDRDVYFDSNKKLGTVEQLPFELMVMAMVQKHTGFVVRLRSACCVLVEYRYIRNQELV